LKKLTNEIIDERLINYTFFRKSNYVSSKIKITFCCKFCNYEWKAYISNILIRNSSCPKCSKTIRLTNEIIDDRLLGRNILRLDNFINSNTKIKFKCLLDNYIWSSTPNNILNNKNNCPKCSKCARLSNEEIDYRIKDRSIIRTGNFINSNSKITFKCKICNYEWLSLVENIFNGNNCAKCSGNAKLTNEIIDLRLNGRNIIRIRDYVSSCKKIQFKCLLDGHIWETTANKITNQNTGCPKCSNHIKLSNEYVDENLIGRNIKRIEDYFNIDTKILFKCLICNYEWKSTPYNVINRKYNCPKCSNHIKLTNEYVDELLLNRNLKRLEDYIDCNTKIKFKCLIDNCRYIWSSKPYSIIKLGYGCPKCKAPNNESLICGIFIKYNLQFEYHKNIRYINNVFPKYFVDFYISNINTIIEYNGLQHYSPVCFGNISQEQAILNLKKQQKRDNHLQQLCQDNKINLIWIDGRYFKGSKLEKHIIDYIMPKLEV
jgi:hypothetical protein